MKEISDKDKLFYFEKHFFTLDGLWMIETEDEIDWKTALKLDLRVWIRLLKIIIGRIKRYLNLEGNNLANLMEILTFRWSVEGWNYERLDDNRIIINSCPYNEIMARNPERHEKIPLICKDMCIPFYKTIVKDFNNDITVERDKFIGLGNKICNFHFKSSKGK